MIAVYVAGASRNKERARAFVERVQAHPQMSIAYNWIADVDKSDAIGVRDNELHNGERERFARADLEGVMRCDVLVVLAEETPTGRGMWVELGFVLGANLAGVGMPTIVLVAGGGRHSIFTAPGIVDAEYASDALAFEHLAHLAVSS